MKSWLADFFRRLSDMFSPQVVVSSSNGIRPISYPKAEARDWDRRSAQDSPFQFRPGQIIDIDDMSRLRGLQGSFLEAEIQRQFQQQAGANKLQFGVGTLGGLIGGSFLGSYQKPPRP